MKKLWVIPLLAILLAGCGGKTALETVTDIPVAPVVAEMRRIQVQLPPELSSPALQEEKGGTLYLCDEYSVMLQTVQSGDLEKTLRDATGLSKADLQMIQTRRDDAKCYQWVWSANGETGTQVGRGCILDDGAYHYVLTALADEEAAKQAQPAWKEIFASFCLATEREEVSTGS